MKWFEAPTVWSTHKYDPGDLGVLPPPRGVLDVAGGDGTCGWPVRDEMCYNEHGHELVPVPLPRSLQQWTYMMEITAVRSPPLVFYFTKKAPDPANPDPSTPDPSTPDPANPDPRQ